MEKVCNCCGKLLPLEAFAKTSKNKDGRRGKCKQCTKVTQSAWYSANKERINQTRREEYNPQNEHERYEKRREAILSSKKEWRKNNKDLQTLQSEKRRAKEASLPATLTQEEWEECKVTFNFECAYCGAQIKLERDHVIPVTKGGGLERSNVVPACKSCNSSKGNKDLADWYRYKKVPKERQTRIAEWLKEPNQGS